MVVGDSDEVEDDDEGNVCGRGINCLEVEVEEDIVFCCGV